MRVLSAAWSVVLVAGVVSDASALAADPAQTPEYPCGSYCRSREDGYRWAERFAIDNGDRCNGKTQAFVQGCRDFVDEQLARSENDEDDNDDGYDDNDDDNDEYDDDDGDDDGTRST